MGSKPRPQLGDTQPWETRLVALYEELLEQPLLSFDTNAVYDLYHNASQDTFGSPPPTIQQLRGLVPYSLSTDKGQEPTNPIMAWEWRTAHYLINLAQSFAVFESEDLTPEPLRAIAKLDEFDQCIVTGEQLLLAEDLDQALANISHFAFHVQTKGSLSDAMLTLLHLCEGPESILCGDEPEGKLGWIDEQISDPAFRSHLEALFSIRDSFLEVPGSDEIDAVVLCEGTPLLSLFTGEGGYYWNIVQRPRCELGQ